MEKFILNLAVFLLTAVVFVVWYLIFRYACDINEDLSLVGSAIIGTMWQLRLNARLLDE